MLFLRRVCYLPYRKMYIRVHQLFLCVPQQAEVTQGVPGRLRPLIFLTFRHYKGGRSSAINTGRLYPRRNPWYSLSEAESTSGHMVLSGEPRKKSPVTPPGIDPGTVLLVAQRLNHYTTPYIYQLALHNRTGDHDVSKNQYACKYFYSHNHVFFFSSKSGSCPTYLVGTKREFLGPLFLTCASHLSNVLRLYFKTNFGFLSQI